MVLVQILLFIGHNSEDLENISCAKFQIHDKNIQKNSKNLEIWICICICVHILPIHGNFFLCSGWDLDQKRYSGS